MSLTKGLCNINIKVPDMDEALRFYCEGLGLELRKRTCEASQLVTPDGIRISLLPGGKGIKGTFRGGFTHVCYNTWDVDKAFARALAYGAVRSRESDPEPYTYKDLRMAFVRAPSGEEIEFWSIIKPDGTFGEAAETGCFIKQFVHVALTVPDMKACIRFYEALGAKLKVDWEWGCSLRLPDMREMELFAGGTYNKSPGDYERFSFLADDPHSAQDMVINMGGNSFSDGFSTGLSGEGIEFTNSMAAPPPLPDLFAREQMA